MMGLDKPQRLAKFEVAGFIYYGNIRKFVFFLNWDKPKWGNPLLFGEIDFTVGFADPMFSIRCDCCGASTTANGRFLWKTAFYNGKCEGCKVGVENLCTKLPNGTPLRQTGRTNRLAYVAVTLFWHYTAARKKVRENRHRKIESSTTLRRYRDVVMCPTPSPTRTDGDWHTLTQIITTYIVL